MKERYCFGCERRLDKKDFLKYNSHQNKEDLIHLWNHPFVEFFCCECYRGEILSNRGLIYFPDQAKILELAMQNQFKIEKS